MTKYQPFNDLPAAQFHGLVEDIAKRGVILPILVDENGKTIDGHQRRRAAAEAGVECPKVVIEGLTEDEKQTLALTLNLFRRHLAGVERSAALQKLANLGMSTRRMADITGLSKSTVHRALEDVERPDTIVGADGREQPAVRPRTVPSGTVPPGVDPETGEIVSSMDDKSSVGEDVPSAAGSGAGEDVAPGQTREAPSPSPAVPAVDPVLGYRARATTARSQVRDSLLTLDAARVIETSDDPKAWTDLSSDLRGWLDELDAVIAGPRLKAVQ